MLGSFPFFGGKWGCLCLPKKTGILLFSGLETPPLHVGFCSGTQKLMVKILGCFFLPFQSGIVFGSMCCLLGV